MIAQQYLALTEGFKPFYNEFQSDISINRFTFSGGEEHIKLLGCRPNIPCLISGRFNSSADVIVLLLVVDALKREKITEISLLIPYLPYARQDRVMVEGEPLSIKVFADLINSCGFKNVKVFDPHSDVSVALINNCEVITNYNFIKTVIWSMQYVCCPDAGAEKKIYALCQDMGYDKEIIFGRKHRNVITGKLESVDVINQSLPDDILIIDDICDGGGTFTMLAQKIKTLNPNTKVSLAVSHGIFSKGLPLESIDKVYCTNSFQSFSDTEYYTEYNL